MTEDNKSEELDSQAAEYVLGTLTRNERLDVEIRMKRDPALALAVEAWRARLAPLSEEMEPVTPPAGSLSGILAKIDKNEALSASPSGEVVELEGRVKLWRRATVLAGAIAASLLVLVAVRGVGPGAVDPGVTSPQYGEYVAVLSSGDKKPDFVAGLDPALKKIVLFHHGEKPSSGTDFEVWAIGGGRAKPVSLGLVKPERFIQTLALDLTGDEQLDDMVLAISEEPVGGSPTGQPTGPVLYSGKVRRIKDK